VGRIRFVDWGARSGGGRGIARGWDRSARDAGTVGAPGPESRVNIGRTDPCLYPNRHRLLVPFANPDRAREVAATDAPRSAGGQKGDGPSLGQPVEIGPFPPRKIGPVPLFPISCFFRSFSEPSSERHERPRYSGDGRDGRTVSHSHHWAEGCRRQSRRDRALASPEAHGRQDVASRVGDGCLHSVLAQPADNGK